MKQTTRILLCVLALLFAQSLMTGCNRGGGGEKKDTPKDTEARKKKKDD